MNVQFLSMKIVLLQPRTLGLKRIYKEVRKRTGPKSGGGFVTLGYIDYIVEKAL